MILAEDTGSTGTDSRPVPLYTAQIPHVLLRRATCVLEGPNLAEIVALQRSVLKCLGSATGTRICNFGDCTQSVLSPAVWLVTSGGQ
jgi:hypothetical protein